MKFFKKKIRSLNTFDIPERYIPSWFSIPTDNARHFQIVNKHQESYPEMSKEDFIKGILIQNIVTGNCEAVEYIIAKHPEMLFVTYDQCSLIEFAQLHQRLSIERFLVLQTFNHRDKRCTLTIEYSPCSEQNPCSNIKM